MCHAVKRQEEVHISDVNVIERRILYILYIVKIRTKHTTQPLFDFRRLSTLALTLRQASQLICCGIKEAHITKELKPRNVYGDIHFLALEISNTTICLAGVKAEGTKKRKDLLESLPKSLPTNTLDV